MVFSEGFPREVRFQSPILDLEGRENVNALRRAADVPSGTRPSLDWVSLDFADPIAERVSAEVYPFQVEPGTMATFSYWLRTPATREGFDRLAIEASAPLRFVDTRLDGAPIEVQAREDSAGFRLQFPAECRAANWWRCDE